MKLLLSLLAAPLALSALPVAAQDSPPPPPPSPEANTADANRDTLTIGAGAVFLPTYQGSNDYVLSPVAAARGQ